jgi:hypothetical protein
MKYFFILAIFVITYLSFSMAQIPMDSLVAYYPFNGNANDESGNGNNGTVNGVSFVNVVQGTIAQFASTGYIEVADNASFDFSNVPGVTIETWIRLEQATTGYIVQKEGPSGLDDDEYMINVQTSDGQLLGAFTGLSSQHTTISSVNKLALNTWYNVILMWNQTNGNVSFYINGILDNTVSSSVTSIQNTIVPITIGRSYQGTQGFVGSLDEVRIYKRVLSDSEIQALYRDHGRGLIASYPFNNNANDESGNEHHGIVYGATLTTDRFGIENKAYTFDGTNSYISTFNLNPINNISVSLWFNKTSFISNNPNVLYSSGDANGAYFNLYLTANGNPEYVLSKSLGNGQGGRSTLIPSPESWHHIVLTRTDSIVEMFIDNIKQSMTITLNQGSLVGTIATTVPLFIGAGNSSGSPNNFFNGLIDDICIYDRILNEEEIKALYNNYRHQIISITDIPNDQGGKVRITWDKIYLDTTGANPQVTSYGVWRKIPTELLGKRTAFKAPFSIMNDTLGTLYDYLGTVNAVQSPSYNFVAQTLADSDATGPHDEKYLITAHTADPNIYYISDQAMGHSIDNLAPSAVTAFQVVCPITPLVQLSWSPNLKDHDLKTYNIYRSSVSNFIPTPSNNIGSTTETSYQDNTITEGYKYYYKVCCVDVHDNLSSSDEVSAGYPANRSVTLNSGWNMVSVPMNLDDFSKAAIFPSAISDAYEYNGAYQTSDPLEMGKGYWVKFGSAETRSLSGYLIGDASVDVIEGWNMIGSVSEVINVANIISDPPNIKVSEFFAYDSSSYRTRYVITPGSGYWVKVNAAGKLTLSTSITSSANKITIVPSAEMPPQPPTNGQSTAGLIPAQYMIEQNYPNPFNPTTMIRYALPNSSHVTLSVFNTLGEQVALLVSGQQDAGYHEVTFNAEHLPSGVYFYRLQAGSYAETKKLLLIK